MVTHHSQADNTARRNHGSLAQIPARQTRTRSGLKRPNDNSTSKSIMARVPLVFLCCLAIADVPDFRMPVSADEKAAKDPAPKRAKPKFTISKETTVVAGPLDKDG